MAESAVEVPAGRVWTPGWWAAAWSGVVVAGSAVAVAELLAAVGVRAEWWTASASPLASLGAAFIDLSPVWLIELGKTLFGTADKIALGAGMAAVMIALAALIGLVARRSPRVAAGALAGLVAVCAVAVLTRPDTGVAEVIPVLAGGAAGLGVLGLLYRRTVQDWTLVGRPEDPGPQLDRRRFLVSAGWLTAGAAAAGVLARFLPSAVDVERNRAALTVPTPESRQPSLDTVEVPGQATYFTANEEFYRIDTAWVVPTVAAEDWSLRLHGLVDREIDLDYAAVVARPQIERAITLTCVSNEVGGDLIGNARWIGTLLAPLLTEAGVQDGADCLLCTSVDGFTLTAPLAEVMDGRDAMLAVAMNGEILPAAHGFPVRMVIPGLYGYVSACKWVTDIKVSRFADEVAFWTERGWAERGPIKTSSRIDVPRSSTRLTEGTPVAIAGIAWAQHRGIEAVQVQVDDGPWLDAEVAEVLSTDTWRQWRLTWTPDSPGPHVLRCRAVDGTGEVQDETVRPVLPDGATGYHTRTVQVG